MQINSTTYKIDNFLERYILPKLIQKDIKNLNSPIFIKEIAFVFLKSLIM